MQSWVGQHKSKLIASWGPPQNISSDGLGGQVYTYYLNRNGTMNTTYNSYTNILVTTNNSYTATRNFYVGKNGVIYRWRWTGW